MLHTRASKASPLQSRTQLSQKTDQSNNNGRNADGDAECRPDVNPDSTGTDYSERNKICADRVAHAPPPEVEVRPMSSAENV
jgi:hypothetical protein